MNLSIKQTYAYKYAQSVLDGKTVACNYIIKAASRFMEDLKRDDLVFDLEAVAEVTEFFEETIYVPELKAPAQLPLPHAFWIQQIYGFKYKMTGLRRFNEVLLEVGRKNWKTYFAAGFSIYEGLLGPDCNAQILQGANSRDQAIICTDMTGKIIKTSPELKSLLDNGVVRTFSHKEKINRITYEDDGNFCTIEAMPKDPGDGGNPSASVTDEIHEAQSLTLLETVRSGQGQREQPINVIITSPGKNQSYPLFTTLRKKAISMLDRLTVNDRLLALIYEQDKAEDWSNTQCIEKANPMVPYSPTLNNYVKGRITEAQDPNTDGETIANIKIKNCGVWVDAPTVWIPSETIKENNHGISLDDLRGKKCYLGLDLSAGKDLNACVFNFPNVRHGINAIYAMYWIPRWKILNQKEDVVDYARWEQDGHVKVFDGNVVEYDTIAEDINEKIQLFDVQVIGADSKFLYTRPTPFFRQQGHGHLIVPVGQGFNLTAATESVENLTAERRLDFMNNPVTEWCFSNVALHTGKSGHRYPSKGNSVGRIDGVSALCTSEEERLRLDAEPDTGDVGIIGVEW